MITLSRWVSIAVIGTMIALPSVARAQTTQTTPAPTTTTTVPTPAPTVKAEPMDINTATKEQLMTLKGIGDVRSDDIIKGRPYKAKNELVDKKIVPKNVYDTIKEQIIAKQVAASPPVKPSAPNAAVPAKQ